jgi:hypothetical protein
MDLFKRLEGVFFNPRKTFEAVAEKPVWVDVLIVIFILLIAYVLVVSPYTRHDQLQMMKESMKFKEKVGEERANQQIASLEGPPTQWQIIQTVVGMPLWFLIATILQALILLMLGRFVSTQGTFKQVFAALVHANLINALLGNGVRLVLVLSRKSVMQVSTGLALFAPRMEVTSTPYIILNQVDFFQIWMFGVLAYGLSAAFKIDLRKSLFISYSVWLLKALVNVGLGIVGMSFFR